MASCGPTVRHPTVVDLMMLETAMAMPNYEVDREVG